MYQLPSLDNCTLAIIGLGYVGLPLAIEFSIINRSKEKSNIKVIGFDINEERISQLKASQDNNNEVEKEKFFHNKSIEFTSLESKLIEADVFIITVPTPIDNSKKPDLKFIINSSIIVGKALKERSKKQKESNLNTMPIVIYESTVYPGTTEEECIPIIEKTSGLILNSNELNRGFGCGYSPERINPGDKEHQLKNIMKITSGSNPQIANWVDNLYSLIIEAGTYKTISIKVAETAKVIENTQRDINIALINEISIICKLVGIDTRDVLNAAETKWNFQRFNPGFVGGHCIGVDPYYLTHKAEKLGYYPEVVLAGRRMNDSMPKWFAEQVILEIAKKKIDLRDCTVLILGFAFKANCKDIRNTKIIDLVSNLKKYGLNITIVDPMVDKKNALNEYNEKIESDISKHTKYTVIILAIGHDSFVEMSENDWSELAKENSIYFDLTGTIPRSLNPYRL